MSAENIEVRPSINHLREWFIMVGNKSYQCEGVTVYFGSESEANTKADSLRAAQPLKDAITYARFIGDARDLGWWYPGRPDLTMNNAEFSKRLNEFEWKMDVGDEQCLWPFVEGKPLMYGTIEDARKLDEARAAHSKQSEPEPPKNLGGTMQQDLRGRDVCINGEWKTEPWPDSGNYSDPTAEMLANPQWNAIWEEIKNWDINVPSQYGGYCGATGNHATAIFKATSALETHRMNAKVETVEDILLRERKLHTANCGCILSDDGRGIVNNDYECDWDSVLRRLESEISKLKPLAASPSPVIELPPRKHFIIHDESADFSRELLETSIVPTREPELRSTSPYSRELETDFSLDKDQERQLAAAAQPGSRPEDLNKDAINICSCGHHAIIHKDYLGKCSVCNCEKSSTPYQRGGALAAQNGDAK